MEKARELLKIKNSPTPGEKPYRIGKILHEDSFANLNDWIVEQMPGGTAKAIDNTLDVNDKKGCTIWYRHKVSGPVMIEYEVTLKSDARVSDMNCFWMAADPTGKPLLKDGGPRRSGSFNEYHKLKLYYVGCGGHNNSKTRFRRYIGLQQRPMLDSHDLTEKKYLLKPDTTYKIQLVKFGKRVQYFRDGECYFDIVDEEPLDSGNAGFRLVNAHQVFSNFKIYRLEKATE